MIRPEDIAETVRFLTRLGPTAAVPEIRLFRAHDNLLSLS
jgi:NADP-dependent 3-hydroxy acid dehydrogenase YdfG